MTSRDVSSMLGDICRNYFNSNIWFAFVGFVFETPQKNEIGSLIISYFPALSTWITENEVPLRRGKGITNEDRVRLHHNVVVCRRHLVDEEILRKPQDLSGGFLRNTLRRLSKHRLEKLRAEHGSAVDHGETYKGKNFEFFVVQCVEFSISMFQKGFPHAYWAFSRQPLPQSLSKLPDQEEQAMLQVFQAILTYAGLGQNGETVQRAEDEHITLIQSIMDRCMRKESLLNELYLQLIKQTTDHPDPNSRVNLRHWALLSLGCSVILPPLKIVRKYLIGHLKRCASDFITEEGKYARFAEKVSENVMPPTVLCFLIRGFSIRSVCSKRKEHAADNGRQVEKKLCVQSIVDPFTHGSTSWTASTTPLNSSPAQRLAK